MAAGVRPGLVVRGSAALNGVMHHGRRTAGCLSIRVEPRATRLAITPLPVTSRIARPTSIFFAKPRPVAPKGDRGA
jgi:hypothetical protein